MYTRRIRGTGCYIVGALFISLSPSVGLSGSHDFAPKSRIRPVSLVNRPSPRETQNRENETAGPFSWMSHDDRTLLGPLPSDITLTPEEAMIVVATNRVRRSLGFGLLQVDSTQTKICQAHARNMAARRSLVHSGIAFSAASYAQENVGMGANTGNQAVANWMASPSHRVAIVNRSYKHIGVGLINGASCQRLYFDPNQPQISPLPQPHPQPIPKPVDLIAKKTKAVKGYLDRCLDGTDEGNTVNVPSSGTSLPYTLERKNGKLYVRVVLNLAYPGASAKYRSVRREKLKKMIKEDFLSFFRQNGVRLVVTLRNLPDGTRCDSDEASCVNLTAGSSTDSRSSRSLPTSYVKRNGKKETDPATVSRLTLHRFLHLLNVDDNTTSRGDDIMESNSDMTKPPRLYVRSIRRMLGPLCER